MFRLICSVGLLVAFVALAAGETAQFGNAGDSFSPVAPVVIGGLTAHRNEFPHLCAIRIVRLLGISEVVGGGNVINRRWILTVASILQTDTILRHTEVLCGRFDLGRDSEVTEQRMRIARTIRHPQFRSNLAASASDIALLQLTSELHFADAVQPIALPQVDVIPVGVVSLIGWSGTDDQWLGQRLQRLQIQRVAIYLDESCNNHLARFGLTTNATHFCTGPNTGGLSPCDGDRGSSLVQQLPTGERTLIGLVSLPQGCGEPGWLGTYTRVAQFVPWINQQLVASDD